MLDDDLDIGGTRPQTGVSAIDSNIGNGFNPGIHAICGPSGCGKTALLLQTAAEAPFPVVYLNLEMQAEDIAKRLIARNSDTDISSLPKMSKDELGQLKEIVRNKVGHVTLKNGKQGYVSFEFIKDTVEEIISSQHPETVVIVIDSFTQWIETARSQYPDKSRDDIAKDMLTKLIDLCDEKKTTVLLSVQETAEAKEMNRAVEFASETFINLRWELSGRVDTDGLKKSKMNISKNRNGVATTRIISFSGSRQEFRS